jgi:hypothetical protein
MKVFLNTSFEEAYQMAFKIKGKHTLIQVIPHTLAPPLLKSHTPNTPPSCTIKVMIKHDQTNIMLPLPP